jgi:hypothetical protein
MFAFEFEYIVLTLIIIIAEKEISIVARPPIDINKLFGFSHRILVLQSERDADLLNNQMKLLRTKSKYYLASQMQKLQIISSISDSSGRKSVPILRSHHSDSLAASS